MYNLLLFSPTQFEWRKYFPVGYDTADEVLYEMNIQEVFLGLSVAIVGRIDDVSIPEDTVTIKHYHEVYKVRRHYQLGTDKGNRQIKLAP